MGIEGMILSSRRESENEVAPTKLQKISKSFLNKIDLLLNLLSKFQREAAL